MEREKIVLEVIGKISNRHPDVVKPEHELVADLGIDSSKGLNLLAELEDRLKIEISDEAAAKMNTVSDVLAYVKQA
ncbi:MAG: acyl carrier protein [Planctomycetota bacterium]|nr:acyl carrier protein [Planctomycetota bacterium]